MFNELTTLDILIALSGGLALLLFAACFDLYLIRRHRSAANATYLTNLGKPDQPKTRFAFFQ